MAKKILIIEDERALCDALITKFKKEKFDVLVGYDGEAGLELALSEHPDLILLDIVMPKMDGMTMLARLRRDNWGKDVPVVILTNLSDELKVVEAVKNKSFDYLVKSDWHLDDVVEKVRQRLGL
jgi:DNA-binding response OmpR family regulator